MVSMADPKQNHRLCDGDNNPNDDDESWIQSLCDDDFWASFLCNNDFLTSSLYDEDKEEHHLQVKQKEQHNPLLQSLFRNNFPLQCYEQCVSDYLLLPVATPTQRSSPVQLQERPQKRMRMKSSASHVVAFKTRSETTQLDDGFRWQKYGAKILKHCIHPRNYYKCTEDNCDVKKTVEKDPEDEGIVINTYTGTHNHLSPWAVKSITREFALSTPAPQESIVVIVKGSSGF